MCCISILPTENPEKLIAEPAGFFMAPQSEERVGDVSNVLFSNGWIADEMGKVFIYYASSDTRMHVATSTIDKLLDYVLNTPADGYRSAKSIWEPLNLWLQTIKNRIMASLLFMFGI